MADLNKAAAIFTHHIHLKEALGALESNGFKDISVLIKSEEDREEAGTEVRTYSTTTYPPTTKKTETISHATSYTGSRFEERQIKEGNVDAPVTDASYRTGVMPADHVDTYEDRGTEVRRVDKRVHNIEDSIQEHHEDVSVKDPNALTKGSVTGGVLGAVAGAAALLIPGVGPVLAAGPIASAIGAAAAGGAVGMTAGAIGGILKDEGLPSDRVSLYRKAFDQGKGIVIVDPSGDLQEQRVLEARDILNRFRPETVDTF